MMLMIELKLVMLIEQKKVYGVYGVCGNKTSANYLSTEQVSLYMEQIVHFVPVVLIIE